MELREKIARRLVETAGDATWAKLSDLGMCGPWLKFADAILSIPEIRDALRAKQELMLRDGFRTAPLEED